MIGEAEVRHYREHGYLVIPNLLDAATVAALRERTELYLESARGKVESDAVHDLEESHRPEMPRVRRIKDPCNLDGLFYAAARRPEILGVVAKLIGPNIRYHHSKINIKAAGYGAAVEWHQDWAFYPATNDDILEIGIAIDPCEAENGPMMVLPGSHKGPVYDHHADGRFCGAFDAVAAGIDLSRAVSLLAPAGSITVHHVRMVHGSTVNRSNRPRRLFLIGYAAADALSLTEFNGDWDKYHGWMVAGEDTILPRVEPVPVRMPFPRASHQGSIYENQRSLKNPYFDKIKAT
jgi:ectoine hydroxylase-related dioxygenase (phytanoyl-CoA dioxygenase family)